MVSLRLGACVEKRRDERVNQYQSSDGGAITIWHVSRIASVAAASRWEGGVLHVAVRAQLYLSIGLDGVVQGVVCWSTTTPSHRAPLQRLSHAIARRGSTTALLKMPLPSSSTATLCSPAPQSSGEPQQQRATNSAGVAEAQYPRVQRPEGVFRAGTCAHMYAQHEPSDERNSSTPMLPSFEPVKVCQTAVPLDRAPVFTPEREP